MIFDPKENKQTMNDQKIVSQDGFNFIDDDDEPIILYEDFVNQELKTISKPDENKELTILENEIENDFLEIEQTNNDNNNQQIDNQNQLNETETSKQTITTTEPIKSSENQIQASSNQQDIELNEIESDTKKTNKMFLNYSNPVDKNIVLVDVDQNSQNKKNTNQKTSPKIYFINNHNEKETKQNIKNEFENIKDEDYNRYIVISGDSAKQVFQKKFIFSIILTILWAMLLIADCLVLTLGIISQIKNSNIFHFNNYDYIPTILVILLSGSFFIYQLICILKFKFARNEFISDKKIDEIDLIKITKIYKQNKMFFNFLLWLLLSISFLFMIDLIIIYFVNQKSFYFLEHNFLYKFFICSIVAYIFLIIIIIIYLISYILLNKIIENDYNYKNNKILIKFKKINKKSNYVGLITFLSCTIIGIIIYYIAKLIIHKINSQKKE